MTQASQINAPQATHTVWIDNAKFAAILAVIVLHVSAVTLSESPRGEAMWWLSALLNAASRWGVPVFVMLSGAALLGTGRIEAAGTFYRKRISKVVIPLMFWSAFYIAWAALPALVKGDTVSWTDRLLRWCQGRPYYHLWFLYMILGLYLITPWLRLAMRDMELGLLRRSVIALLLVTLSDGLWRALGWTSGNDFFLLWGLDYLPYFLLGGCIARQSSHGQEVSAGGRRAWLLAGLALAVICAGQAWLVSTESRNDWRFALATYWLDNQGVPVMLLSLTLLPLLRTWQRPLFSRQWTQRMAALSFGIYLVHPVILDILRATHLQQQVWSWLGASFMLAAAVTAVFLASLGLASLLAKLPYLRRLV